MFIPEERTPKPTLEEANAVTGADSHVYSIRQMGYKQDYVITKNRKRLNEVTFATYGRVRDARDKLLKEIEKECNVSL